MKFNPEIMQFEIKSTDLDALKDYFIELSLIDNFNARTIYPFKITLYDPLKLTKNSKNFQ
jgi:hypothetical protein